MTLSGCNPFGASHRSLAFTYETVQTFLARCHRNVNSSVNQLIEKFLLIIIWYFNYSIFRHPNKRFDPPCNGTDREEDLHSIRGKSGSTQLRLIRGKRADVSSIIITPINRHTCLFVCLLVQVRFECGYARRATSHLCRIL